MKTYQTTTTTAAAAAATTPSVAIRLMVRVYVGSAPPPPSPDSTESLGRSDSQSDASPLAYSSLPRARSRFPRPTTLQALRARYAMSDRMQDALDEVLPAIKQIIRKVRDEDDGQLKAAFGEIKQMLLNHRLAAVVKIPNAQVLVCPSNRFGAGLEVSDVHTILDDICNVGVDWELIGVPMCFEVPAGAEGNEVVIFNEQQAKDANGFLAPVDVYQDEYVMSVTCSHRVAAMRCVENGCNHEEHLEENKGQLTNNGKLSVEKCTTLCPTLREAMTGLQWVKVKHEVLSAMPELAAFLSEAGNAGSGIAREHTVTQVMLQVHQKAMTNQMATGDCQWDKVASAIERQHIGMQGQVRDLVAYVAAWSGGSVPIFLQELDAFAKTLAVRRRLSPFIMGALAKVKMSQSPEFITACVLAMLASPTTYTNATGESTLINGSEVHSISEKHKTKVLQASKIIKSAREWAREVKLPKALATRTMGDLQQRLVMHVLNKRGKVVFKTIDDIAAQFLKDVEAADAEAFARAQAPFAKKEVETETKPKAGAPMRSFASGGVGPQRVASRRQAWLRDLRPRQEAMEGDEDLGGGVGSHDRHGRS